VRRLGLAAAAVACLAALPAATAQAAPPHPEPFCVFTVRGMICTTDIGPAVMKVVQDPYDAVCHNEAIECAR
jgi:hypothetical protein